MIVLFAFPFTLYYEVNFVPIIYNGAVNRCYAILFYKSTLYVDFQIIAVQRFLIFV